MIKRSTALSDRVWDIFRPAIQKNAYFCHPENVLIILINNSDEYKHKIGWRSILEARKFSPDKLVRVFVVPTFNLNGENYYDLIRGNLLPNHP